MKRLTVLVSPCCNACVVAESLARRIRAEHQQLSVEVVDITAAAWTPPADFAGTPMYYIDGVPAFFGNPTYAELECAIANGQANA